MSQENVELVRRTLEALRRQNRRESDAEPLLAFLDPRIVWEIRSDFPDAQSYSGHQGVRRMFATFREALQETWYRPLDFIDRGSQVVVPLQWGGRGKGGGVEFIESEEAWVFTVRDGSVIHIKEYAELNSALEAVGSSE